MHDFNQPGTVVLRDNIHWEFDFDGDDSTLGWVQFTDPLEIIEVRASSDAEADLQALQKAWQRLEQALHKHWVAGFLAYEAAPLFGRELRVCLPALGAPLLWFGVYRAPQAFEKFEPVYKPLPRPEAWHAAWSEAEFTARVQQIREYIARGDTYQVNLSYPLHADYGGDPVDFFRALKQAVQPHPVAYLRGSDFAVASASPELFFGQRGDEVLAVPMKGTAPRGRWLAEDEQRRAELASNPKEQAENLMIVDLLRNDLGRVARNGTVDVTKLYSVDPYPTVWQMTSWIKARTDRNPLDVLAALFPCGSVTGAPKIRTMELIAELERTPRGLYCGAIGYISPQRQAQFNVAIRTAFLDLTAGTATYNVGSGITWDSEPSAEYTETQAKRRILHSPTSPSFELFESMLWEPGAGFYLTQEHLDRMEDSAKYFNFPFDPEVARQELARMAANNWPEPMLIRLRLESSGKFLATEHPLIGPSGVAEPHAATPAPGRLAISPMRVDSRDPFVFHKTSLRGFYEIATMEALEHIPRKDKFDYRVLLLNERDEVTEFTNGNLVVERAGEWLTPARDCGLLNGVLRQKLLSEGRIAEARLTLEDVRTAEQIYFINSVRRWLRCAW